MSLPGTRLPRLARVFLGSPAHQKHSVFQFAQSAPKCLSHILSIQEPPRTALCPFEHLCHFLWSRAAFPPSRRGHHTVQPSISCGVHGLDCVLLSLGFSSGRLLRQEGHTSDPCPSWLVALASSDHLAEMTTRRAQRKLRGPF